jgi:hypothetical protein
MQQAWQKQVHQLLADVLQDRSAKAVHKRWHGCVRLTAAVQHKRCQQPSNLAVAVLPQVPPAALCWLPWRSAQSHPCSMCGFDTCVATQNHGTAAAAAGVQSRMACLVRCRRIVARLMLCASSWRVRAGWGFTQASRPPYWAQVSRGEGGGGATAGGGGEQQGGSISSSSS